MKDNHQMLVLEDWSYFVIRLNLLDSLPKACPELVEGTKAPTNAETERILMITITVITLIMVIISRSYLNFSQLSALQQVNNL